MYSVAKVPAAPLAMRVRFDEGGFERSILRAIELRGGQTLREDFDFDSADTSYIAGTVLLDGRPAPNVILRALFERDNGDTAYYQTKTCSDGSYILGPVPTGPCQFGTNFSSPFQTVFARLNETAQHDMFLASD